MRVDLVIVMSDQHREALIANCQVRLAEATDPQRAAAIWELMTDLINGRSPEQVARMERARGLN